MIIAPTTYTLSILSCMLTLSTGICLVSNSRAQTGPVPAELIHYPDIVFFNGQVLTTDADLDFTITEAVAVRGNQILAVGTSAHIQRLAGPDTRIFDLKGRTLAPGFIYNDADNSVPAGDILKDSMWNGVTHPHLGGRTLDEALATLAKIIEVEGEPGKPFFFNLIDQYSSLAMQACDIKTLNEVAPNNPVMIYLTANNGMANQAMLDLAIERGLPPGHFQLDRDDNGNYTGNTGSQVSGFIGREVRPWPDPVWFDEVAIPMAVKSLANYARHGVTVATGHMSAPTMTILNRLFNEQPKDLAVRVYPGLDFLRQNPNGEMYLKRMGNLVDFSLVDERGKMVTIVGASVGPHAGAPDSVAGLLNIYPKLKVIPEISANTHGHNSWSSQWCTGLTRKAAFLALTRWAARFVGAENEMGSIQPGKLADLVMFNGNLLDRPVEKLHELKPVLTLVGGKGAYEAGE